MKLNSLFVTLGLLAAVTIPAFQAQAKGNGQAKEAKLLQKFDANKNGVLDPEEKAAADKHRADMIAKYDKNGDGKLDQAEREAMKAERAQGKGKGKGKAEPK